MSRRLVHSPIECRDRPFRDEEDWWRIRALLVEAQPLVPPGWTWDIRHWDGNRFHRDPPVALDRLARSIHLWESPTGLLGAAQVEPDGDAFFQLRPDARDVEPSMVAWAEAYLAHDLAGAGHIETPVMDVDLERQRLVAARAWKRLDDGSRIRRLRLEGSDIPAYAIADGYAIRTTSPETITADSERIAVLHNSAFGRTIHTAGEYLAFSAGSPSFRYDLDLIAVAPDGSFAAHVGCTLDEQNQLGIVEPVCTHPSHRRRGLARALLLEGLRRLKQLGARLVELESGDGQAVDAFYVACGFAERFDFSWWRYETTR